VSTFYEGTVSKIRIADGAILATVTLGSLPEGMVSDGQHLWVALADARRVATLRLKDAVPDRAVKVGPGPVAVAFDGSSIWVANNGSNTVCKITPP
jgi:DNA-binding beta-propeller fold protein YncE